MDIRDQHDADFLQKPDIGNEHLAPTFRYWTLRSGLVLVTLLAILFSHYVAKGPLQLLLQGAISLVVVVGMSFVIARTTTSKADSFREKLKELLICFVLILACLQIGFQSWFSKFGNSFEGIGLACFFAIYPLRSLFDAVRITERATYNNQSEPFAK